jgi:hypothetical protein
MPKRDQILADTALKPYRLFMVFICELADLPEINTLASLPSRSSGSMP